MSEEDQECILSIYNDFSMSGDGLGEEKKEEFINTQNQLDQLHQLFLTNIQTSKQTMKVPCADLMTYVQYSHQQFPKVQISLFTHHSRPLITNTSSL